MIITLAGPIGVGKSSMTKLLSELLETKAVYEPVEDNPLLEKFYADKQKYGFLFQIYMLSKRFELIQEAMSVKNDILDRSMYEDSIFLNMLKELEPLPKKSPDLMIVLNCSFDEEIKRINKRARDFEKVEEGTELYEYFRTHHANYQEWMNKDLGFPKLIIDVTSLDYVNNQEHRREVLMTILDELFHVGAISGEEHTYFSKKACTSQSF